MRNKTHRGPFVIELLVSAIVAATLSRVVQGGFYVPDALHASYGANFLVCLILQGILFAAVAFPRRKWVIRGAYVAVCLVAVGIAVATATTLNPVWDVPENYFVVVVIFALVNALVFAMGRRQVAAVVLFGLAGFVVGYIQLNYASCMTGTSFVLLLSSLILIGLRSWIDASRVAVASKGMASFKSLVGVFAVPVAACALGFVVVAGVIMPLNPPYLTVELQTEYLAYPEEYVKTAVSPEEDPDNIQQSNDVDESKSPETTSDKWQDPDAQMEIGSQSTSTQDNSQMDETDQGGQGVTALALNKQFPWLLLVVAIIVVLLALLFGVPFAVRRLRLRKIKKLSPNDQIDALYQFFLQRFKRLGIARPATLSAIDYANLFRARIAPFAGSQEAGSFDHLTALYIAQRYAGEPVREDDLDAMYYLYDVFYDNARRELGALAFRTRYATL